jgi:glucose-1-phosphate cytidylyltransferase
LELDGNTVTSFKEKPAGDGGRINGGYFVLDPKVIDYIAGDSTSWELEPLMTLAAEGQVNAFMHNGFWQPMDTLRERNLLESLWASDNPPWKVWK